jgi:hypothetical protein
MKTILAALILTVSLAAQAARDVTEFTLFKRNEATQIGLVGLTLKSTDVNKQRFSIDVLTDGHRIEKKDLDIRVPFYFYVGANAQPHELVVMKVSADQIVGRLASPK